MDPLRLVPGGTKQIAWWEVEESAEGLAGSDTDAVRDGEDGWEREKTSRVELVATTTMVPSGVADAVVPEAWSWTGSELDAG
jgi:hypothetical protein